MLKSIKKSVRILAVAVALAFGVTELATGAASANGGTSFTASYSGHITFTACAQANTCGPTDVYATLIESGKATVLGMVTTDSQLRVIGFQGCGQAADIADTMTTTNHDNLFIHVSLVMCPTSTPGVYAGNGTYTITGGTGHLTGASGSGIFQGLGDFAHATITCNLKGTINLPENRQ